MEIGAKYGRMTVLERAGKDRFGGIKVRCICDCGTERTLLLSSLRTGNTKSCGCLLKEVARAKVLSRNTTHGMAGHPALSSLMAAKKRCENPKVREYQRYGGRGIKLEFRDATHFLDTMLPTWFPGATLERVDNDGHYSPENCRWATQAEQARNTCRSVKYTYAGVTKNQSDWASDLGISPSTLQERVERWGVDRALSTPKIPAKGRNSITFNGVTKSPGEWAKEVGITHGALLGRIKKWGIQKALTTANMNRKKSSTQVSQDSCKHSPTSVPTEARLSGNSLSV